MNEIASVAGQAESEVLDRGFRHRKSADRRAAEMAIALDMQFDAEPRDARWPIGSTLAVSILAGVIFWGVVGLAVYFAV